MIKPTTELAARTRQWLIENGFTVKDDALWLAALTHGSTGAKRDYQRLEFLGDRVLGLTVADWLFERNPGAEGQLAQRLNVLVSKGNCAAVARELGASEHILLGKQAREDGAANSNNVLGDVTESLLGANFLDAGFDATRTLIHALWNNQLEGDTGRSKHPKSALQEWAAGNQHRGPEYELVDRSGPDHSLRFTVRVTVPKVGHAEATEASKREAETSAAKAFMKQYG